MATRTLRRRTHVVPSTPTSSYKPINVGVVEKGKKKEDITLDKLDVILGQLYDSKDVSIRTLTGDLKNKYNQAVSYVTILHDSSNYSHLSELIGRRFGGRVEYTPGTIGSYFGGCYVQDPILEGISPGCTPTCLGSIPPGDTGEGYNLCENKVINMTWIGSSYLLTKLNDPQDQSKGAIIYLDGSDEFYGFSTDELQQLKKMNLDNVRIISSNNGRYKELLANTDISSITKRDATKTSYPTKSLEYTKPNIMLWVGVALAIIILIVLLLWRC